MRIVPLPVQRDVAAALIKRQKTMLLLPRTTAPRIELGDVIAVLEGFKIMEVIGDEPWIKYEALEPPGSDIFQIPEHMEISASRMTLEVTNLGVLADEELFIEDVLADGVRPVGGYYTWRQYPTTEALWKDPRAAWMDMQAKAWGRHRLCKKSLVIGFNYHHQNALLFNTARMMAKSVAAQ